MLGIYVDCDIAAEDGAIDVGLAIDEVSCNEKNGRTDDAGLGLVELTGRGC